MGKSCDVLKTNALTRLNAMEKVKNGLLEREHPLYIEAFIYRSYRASRIL